MKFSCPNCTAKYQIGDDKVAGRTVKMKCRKCGTVIPIVAPSKRALEQAPEVHALSIKPSRPGPPTVPASPQRAEWHAGIGGAAQGPLSAAALQALIDSGSASAETFVWKEGMDGWKPLSQVVELAHLLAAAPASPGPPSMPSAAKAQAVPSPLAARAPTPPRLARHHHPGAPAKVALPKPKLPKLKAPAALASAPLIKDSDALSVVENEKVSPKPPPAAPSRPEQSRPSQTQAEPSRPEQSRPSQTQAEPSRPEQSRPSQTQAEPSRPEQSRPSQTQAAPSRPEQSRPEQSRPSAPMPEVALAGEGVLSVDGPYVANQRPTYESLMMRLQNKRHNPYAIPLAVVGALIFGVTLGFVFFGDQETKVIREVVEVPVQVKEAAAQKEDAPEKGEVAVESPSEEEQSPKSTTTKVAAASPNPKVGGDEAAPTEISKGLKGLAGLEGLGGPSSGPTGTSSAPRSGNPLEASQIQSTVSKYQTSVKRSCWQPALDSRERDAPSSARVTVTMTVSGSGQVTGASTSGDPKGYRGLASCISSKVRSWQFPRSSGTTTVNVPFVFAAQ